MNWRKRILITEQKDKWGQQHVSEHACVKNMLVSTIYHKIKCVFMLFCPTLCSRVRYLKTTTGQTSIKFMWMFIFPTGGQIILLMVKVIMKIYADHIPATDCNGTSLQLRMSLLLYSCYMLTWFEIIFIMCVSALNVQKIWLMWLMFHVYCSMQ